MPQPAPLAPLVDPATGYTIDRGTGYLIHPGTGWLIESGSGYLIDGGSMLYTDFRWDPATGLVTTIAADEEPSAPSPTATPEPTPTPSATPSATATPSPSATAAQTASATPSASAIAAAPSADIGGTTGTGWWVRTLVILGLIGAGALYYVKLRGSSAKASFNR
ncbi:hypothetical protein ACFFON_17200 [Arthrobacter citreus]|uniref:hypothetical protein n=1 Tax=Arthrobacter citreus TaxID=1670 RepID=UPI0035EFFCDE